MPANYVLLGAQTVGNGGAASVTFSNIPQSGYTDLKVVASARTTYASTVEGSTITFNGSNTYSTRYLQGDGSSAASGSQSILNALLFTGANATANTFGNSEMYIPNYLGSSQKSVSGDGVSENNSTQAFAGMFAGLASLTSAITTITIAGNAGGSFASGSTFYLYATAAVGTTPVLAPFASGGDVIANDGTYWYHAFKTTGAFVPAKALSADILVVAGGGGGGSHFGGGGGAGGLLGFTSQALLLNNSYTCTIGAGGAGGLQASTRKGVNGNNSQFGSLTATIGGGGGGARDGGFGPGVSGGSGGGGTEGGAGGAGTSGQGYAGGLGNNNSPAYGGAGGGGATAVGADGASTAGGNGGAGSSAYSSWATATATGSSSAYAGGGGGGTGVGGYGQGTGGTGGGGNGGGTNSGVANTGGGGGGFGSAGTGGNGGSGIVIIRYAMA